MDDERPIPLFPPVEVSRDLFAHAYRGMQRDFHFKGQERDHVPSKSAIRRFAKLRYGLVTPEEPKAERDPIKKKQLEQLCQPELWHRLDGHALSWPIPEHVHARGSRTYSSRNRTAAETDMKGFRDFLLESGVIKTDDEDVLPFLKPPAPGENRRDYGQEYLVFSALADVEALREPLRSAGYQDGDIDQARTAFVGHVANIDYALATMAKNQHRLKQALGLEPQTPEPESENMLRTRRLIGSDRDVIRDMLEHNAPSIQAPRVLKAKEPHSVRYLTEGAHAPETAAGQSLREKIKREDRGLRKILGTEPDDDTKSPSR